MDKNKIDELTPSLKPAKMNNDNFDEKMDFFPDLSDEINTGMDGMIPLAEAMDPYPANMNVIPSEEGEEPMVFDVAPVIITSNNQVDVYDEINPDKIQYELFVKDDRTLNAFNAVDDQNYGFEPKYHDLDNAAYGNPQQQQQQFEHNVIYEEYQPDTKEQFAGYMHNQAPAQVYRMEIQQPQQGPYFADILDQKPLHQEEMNYISSPSPAYTSGCQSPYLIDSYFRTDNNANMDVRSGMSTPRSRKYSTTSSCGGGKKIGKVGVEKEKPYRSRRTKAEMTAMSEEQQKEVKKEQNRVNAKNCVSRKNGKKDEMKTRIPALENNLRIVMDNNTNKEEELKMVYDTLIYPVIENNSPFGTPREFREHLEFAKDSAGEQVERDDNGMIMELKEKFESAEANFKKVESEKGNKSVPQNTYASRKSRAKTAKELAEFQFKTHCLDVEIQKFKAFGEALEEFTRKINRLLFEIEEKPLSDKIVYLGFQQFDPS